MKHLLTFIVLTAYCLTCVAQEVVAPVNYNPFAKAPTGIQTRLRTTALSLPFFDDFVQDLPQPDLLRWVNWDTYINNTMGINPVTRGVATFDALNGAGIPYNTANSSTIINADNLTSQPIDISTYQPGDSLYLSFYYQPQGLGFSPEVQDSLIVYFKRRNDTWVKIWGKEGSSSHAFRQVLLPVLDTSFFHPNFQFRFMNKASININDDVWNIDYVKLNAYRTINDTLTNDVAMSSAQPSFLSDYAFMPYHQFKANEGGERAAQTSAVMYNGYGSLQNVNYEYSSREEATNTPLYTGGNGSAMLIPLDVQSANFPVHTNSIPFVNRHNWVSFENKYYLQSLGGTDPAQNDTFTHHQIFHNFLAYDDGTAEKSYYLNLFTTLPGKTAIEFHLNEPDTIGGVAIYFGRQVPIGNFKTFSVAIYRSIAYNGASEDLVYQQDFLDPQYLHVNNFYYYKFDQRVPLPAGTFYMGTIQPALGGSDSLYIGLDANRVGGNHLYYNVNGTWQPSTISGALMVRPLIGPFFPSDIPAPVLGEENIAWSVSPNPAKDWLQFNFATGQRTTFMIYDMQGRCLRQGVVNNGDKLNIADLAPGIYSTHLLVNGVDSNPQKIVKQ